MATKKEYTKEERIKKEVTRMNRILKQEEVDESKVKALDGVIQRAAFLKIACEDFEVFLLENGHTEPFQQSPQVPPFNKIRAEATLHQSSVKDYKSLMKQIADTLDIVGNKNLLDDGFDEWNKGDQ